METVLIKIRKAISEFTIRVPCGVFLLISLFLETIAYALWYVVLFITAIFGNVGALRNSWVNQYPLMWTYFRRIATNLHHWSTDIEGDSEYFNLTKLGEPFSVLHGFIVFVSALLTVTLFTFLIFKLIGWSAVLVLFLFVLCFSLVFWVDGIDKENGSSSINEGNSMPIKQNKPIKRD